MKKVETSQEIAWMNNDTWAQQDFSEIHARYKPYVLKILQGFCTPNSIEDVCQDSFLEVYRSMNSMLFPKRIRAWIATITCRVAIRHIQKPYKRKELVERGSETGPLDHMDLSSFPSDLLESKQQVQQLLGSLCARDKFIATKVWIEGYTSAEVGTKLGMADSSVRTRLKAIRSIILGVDTHTKNTSESN
jgi:RNA polymerase sigma factor (sigma-70 family)